ncbi:Hypothetical protein, putative [Bodo saltans]|uniref:Uncharacterized protein n=1 Tax=Bodo saltans TaxID=75058 RepID=A0A0S4JGJ8_BODSA|nr:Hypothetical protein, putative [Bodo saltans]|eukprot:CUG88107.1 Hypothetical protein, putative [Bodo saltans]
MILFRSALPIKRLLIPKISARVLFFFVVLLHCKVIGGKGGGEAVCTFFCLFDWLPPAKFTEMPSVFEYFLRKMFLLIWTSHHPERTDCFHCFVSHPRWKMSYCETIDLMRVIVIAQTVLFFFQRSSSGTSALREPAYLDLP